MRTLTASIGPEGAVLDVQVGLAAADLQLLHTAGRPVPTPAVARALVDTGAEVSCVDSQLLDALRAVGVAPQRFVFANFPAAGGLTLAPEYAVGLTIMHPSSLARDRVARYDSRNTQETFFKAPASVTCWAPRQACRLFLPWVF
jgi:hypothetical protein